MATKRRRFYPGSTFDGDDLAELLAETLRAFSASVQSSDVRDVQIPEPMFRKLISLCHPDKHQNSETSQEVTRWLLAQRANAK